MYSIAVKQLLRVTLNSLSDQHVEDIYIVFSESPFKGQKHRNFCGMGW